MTKKITSKSKNSKFQKGSGMFRCECCDRQTRHTGEQGLGAKICPECWDLAGYTNMLSDNGELSVDCCREVISLRSSALKRGADEAKLEASEHELFEYARKTIEEADEYMTEPTPYGQLLADMTAEIDAIDALPAAELTPEKAERRAYLIELLEAALEAGEPTDAAPATTALWAGVPLTSSYTYTAQAAKRLGSAAAQREAAYREAKTVAQFRALGGTAADLRWDIAHGRCVID